MSAFQADLFAGGKRLVYDDAVELTLASLQAYGPQHDHWCIAWSGGKDSSCLLTLVVHLISAGRLVPPRTLTVLYADTRMELLPLWIAAATIREQLARFPMIRTEVVIAPIDDRLLVYMLGRGVPPPSNTFRWCTGQIKVEPMEAALARTLDDMEGQILLLTGVREGESAMRDKRIHMACGKDGAECGQGWYQEVLPNAKGVRGRIAVLAPILHWRVCNVWDWLRIYAPMPAYGGWATAAIADAYGGDEAAEKNARTGCTGCSLASEDQALKLTVATPFWSYLRPLFGLKLLYRELKKPQHRVRKEGWERRKDGSIAANPQRMGPLTMDARRMGLARVLGIQAEVNTSADMLGRPRIDILDQEEEARILALIEANTWPQKWTGEEPRADVPLDAVFADGTVQPLLIGALT